MEVSQDQLIGIALNALGYLAAGALWMVIYSFFKDRRKAGAAVNEPVRTTGGAQTSPETVSPAREKTPVEFINLSRSSGAADKPVATSPATGAEQNRRNRAEVIKMAREMLKANISSEKIKHSLPITEGELAMIKNK
ncbi:MAG: hypothetical protein JXA92_03870 [candidate division Zixibacteria bacterium]|nr:hypothetical protein [candidate division Zixibacteria bacterium]